MNETNEKRLGEKGQAHLEKKKKKEEKKAKKAEKKANRPAFFRIPWWKIGLKATLATGVVVVAGGAVYVSHTLKDVPNIQESTLRSDSSSNMYAADGTLIWSSAKYKRNYVEYKDIPKSYVNLLLSTEDSEYWTNKGFSPKGMTNAVISQVKEKLGHGSARGGSGIEQQLVKQSVFSVNASDRTVSRKVKELYLAMQMDKNYSKEKILEFYINKIYMGENSYGAQTIANVYFNKDLKDLTLSQQAIIAGIGQAPSSYNLYDNAELVRQRRDQVLSAALNKGTISKADYKAAKATPVTQGLINRYSREALVDQETKDHNGFVSSALNQVKSMGYRIDETPLQIRTTLDRGVENKVRDIFDNRHDLFQDQKQQAAATIVDPRTGSILAEVGGRYSQTINGLNRATSTTRSSGSSIKPVLDYGPAMDYLNWGSQKSIDGSPYTYAGTSVVATDYGGVTHGWQPLRVALRSSYNTPAIRTLNAVGDSRAREFIGKLGIQTDQQLTESVALGLNVSTTQLASAMGAFGQEGVYHPKNYLTSIEFSDKSVKEVKMAPVQAMRASTAYIMTDILKQVPSQSGTMANGAIPGVVQAAKTGTVGYPAEANVPAMASMDLWTTGYTKSLSIALWQGYDSPMEPGNYMSQYWSLNYSHELYKVIMTELSKGRDNSDWKQPSTVARNGESLTHLDSPAVTQANEFIKNSVATKDSYSDVTGKTTKGLKATMPETPTVPSDYKEGQWQNELAAEQAKFNEEHKNDKENAKNVRDDE